MSLSDEPIAYVRQARPADATTMATVHTRSWRATYAGLVADAVIDDVVASQAARADRWRGWLADADRPGGSFVAELDHRLVGFVFWGPSEGPDVTAEIAEVYAIYVDPDASGRGVGRALMAAATDAARAHGFSGGVLWVLDRNERARRFYEAVGWRADGMTKVQDRPGGSLYEVRYATTFGPPNEGHGG